MAVDHVGGEVDETMAAVRLHVLENVLDPLTVYRPEEIVPGGSPDDRAQHARSHIVDDVVAGEGQRSERRSVGDIEPYEGHAAVDIEFAPRDVRDDDFLGQSKK